MFDGFTRRFARRAFAACLAALLAFLSLVGCGRINNMKVLDESNGKLNVVATIFPYYDFIRQIAKDRVNLVMAEPAGMDTHSFEPTAADMIAIGKADVIIYNGGEMETWVEKTLDAASNKDMRAVSMMDGMGLLSEEEASEADGAIYSRSARKLDEYDEHIWTSPVNAQKIVSKIARTLSDADKKNASFYKKNAKEYNKRLARLDLKIRGAINASPKKFLLFGDKFPLKYFVDEYGLEYGAAFSGCSTESEPSADAIASLIDRARAENVKAVLKIELTSPKVANAIAEAAGARVMTFYSCHNVTARQFKNGATYCGLMYKNLRTLKAALR